MVAPANEQIRILLADSDDIFLSVFQEYLKGLGYEVLTARGGHEAVDIAQKQKPHLLILETVLPGLSGLEVCRLLKSDDATRDTLIIFLSADGSLDNKTEALITCGGDDFLEKPFIPRELGLRIAALLHSRQLKPPRLTPAMAEMEAHRRPASSGAATSAQKEAKTHLQIFLCHSSGDKPAVRDLYNLLRSRAGYVVPWLDEEDLLPGQWWEDEIPVVVRNSDIVLVCLSKGSIQKTGYVQKEIKYALDAADAQPEGTIFIIPVKLEACQIPNRLGHLHYVNLFEERGFEKLLRALKARAEQVGIRANL